MDHDVSEKKISKKFGWTLNWGYVLKFCKTF